MRNIESPAKSKMATRGSQDGRRGLEMGPILGYWALQLTFAIKVFGSEHSFYEKHRATYKIQNGSQWATKWPTESGKGLIPRILGALINFRKISFLIWSLLLWEKVATENRKKMRKKQWWKLPSTLVVAGQPPNSDRLQYRLLMPISLHSPNKLFHSHVFP